MKLCMVTSEYPYAGRYHGGIGTTFRELARGFAAQGYAVHVVTRAERSACESSWKEDSVMVHAIHPGRVRVKGFWRLEAIAPGTSARLQYAFAVNRKLQKLIAQERINIVLSAEWGAETLWFALFEKRVPLIVKVTGPSFIMNGYAGITGFDVGIHDWMESMLLRKADGIVALSSRVADQAAKRLSIRRERIRVIYNPVDIQLFQPNFSIRRDRRVVFVGRLERRKGVEVLAKAICKVHERCPDVEFLFVGRDMPVHNGGPSMRSRLLALLNGSSSRVAFLDHLPHEQLVQCYQQGALCVFPSLEEPLGNVCLEAMACGKPVIATSHTGFAELIQDGLTGWLVPPGNEERLAAVILEVLEDTVMQERIGQAARRVVEDQFAPTYIIPKWCQQLEEVLCRGTAR